MADTKLTALTALAAASPDDILYIVDDPGGTPVSKKITVAALFTSPRITTALLDVNGNPLIAIVATASAVDGFTVTNAATANPAYVQLSATGSDSNINIALVNKGTNTGIAIGGTTSSHPMLVPLASGHLRLVNANFSAGKDLYVNALYVPNDTTPLIRLNADGHITLYQSGMYAFASGASATTTMDATLSRNAAGIIQFGTAAANASGSWLATNGTLSGTLLVGGVVTLSNLAGTGSRAVIADATGILSAPVSDARLKMNVTPLAKTINVLGVLQEIEGVYFNYDREAMKEAGRGDFGPQREIGLIYQNVNAALPELAGMHNGFGFVKYDQMVAFLVEVAKAQQAEIGELKRRIQ